MTSGDMKDSDKLWRFTRTAVEIDHRRFGLELREHLTWLGQQIESWLFTPEARLIAHATFAESRAALLG